MSRSDSTFRYKCYLTNRKIFGEIDAIVECVELSVREFSRQVQKADDPEGYIVDMARQNGVRVNTVKFPDLHQRTSCLHILNVYQQFDVFLNEFKREASGISLSSEQGNESLFMQILGCLDNVDGLVSELEIEILEYYREIRNIFMHGDVRPDKAERRRKKMAGIDQSDGILEKYDAPNCYENIQFDDFVLFTKVAKDVEKKLCILARPSNDQIAELLRETRGYRSAQKLKTNPERMRRALIQLCATEYALSKGEADEIVRILLPEH